MAEKGGGPDDPLALRLARLPAGRHGLPREFVAANHRERLIAAFVLVINERGYADTTVAHVIKAAAVSRRTFYEHFESKEDCFLATYDLVAAHLRAEMVAAIEPVKVAAERVRVALAVLLRFLASEPELARLGMVESLAAGPPIADHHRKVIETLAPLLREGAGPPPSGRPPREDTDQAVVAGVASLITRRIVAGETERLEELLPDVTKAALAPYVGVAEAERLAVLPF